MKLVNALLLAMAVGTGTAAHAADRGSCVDAFKKLKVQNSRELRGLTTTYYEAHAGTAAFAAGTIVCLAKSRSPACLLIAIPAAFAEVYAAHTDDRALALQEENTLIDIYTELKNGNIGDEKFTALLSASGVQTSEAAELAGKFVAHLESPLCLKVKDLSLAQATKILHNLRFERR